MPMQENQLIEELLEGRERAFELLVEQYQEMIGNVCMGFVQNQAEAEELTQDVFVEVFKSISKFKKSSKLSTWLYRIAVNKSINMVNHKKRKRQIQTVSMFFGWNSGGQATESDEKERDYEDRRSRNVEAEMEQQEVKKALEQALHKLPEAQRTAFVLRKYEELSYQEMAEIMEVSVPAIESLIHRASKNMKKHLTHFYTKYYQL